MPVTIEKILDKHSFIALDSKAATGAIYLGELYSTMGGRTFAEAAEELLSLGCKIKAGYNTLTILLGGGMASLTLPIPTQVLFAPSKGTDCSDPFFQQSAHKVASFLRANIQVGWALSAKEKEKEKKKEPPPTGKEQKAEKAKAKVVEKDGRVHLRDAFALNQAVFGSSPESTYHVFALGKVNLAAKRDGTSLSVRAEGTFSKSSIKELEAFGFRENKNTQASAPYMSAHFVLENVPVSRVLGALMYCEHLNIKERMADLSQLTLEGGCHD